MSFCEIDLDAFITAKNPNGVTLKWYSSDSEDKFVKNKTRYEDGTGKQFPYTEDSISYRINYHGFRGDNFEKVDGDSFIALGCSMTFGVGLAENQTWPNVLAKKSDMVGYNLGAPGRGYETNFRTLQYWLPKLNPKYVFMLVNPGVRREYFNSHSPPPQYHCIGVWEADQGNLTEHEYEMFMNERDAYVAKTRALYAIKGLCDVYGVEFYGADMACHERVHGVTANIALGPHHHTGNDVARDLEHPGPTFNDKLADIFLGNIRGN